MKPSVNKVPKLKREWNWELNQHLDINTLSSGSGIPVNWICEKGIDHKWVSTPDTRTRQNTNCPYCSNKSLSITNCLQTTQPEIAKLFHPTLNGDLEPNKIINGARKKVWWQCPVSKDHVWQAYVYAMINNRKKWSGSGCPQCYHKKPSITNSLVNYPELLKEWDYKRNKVFPTEVIAGGKTKFWWICNTNRNHKWETSISLRISKETNCPYCNSGMFNYEWREWENLCNKIGQLIYKDDLILQPLTRLPNNKLPDLIVRNINNTIIIDAKTNAYIENIEEDIKNYSPYCDILEFWCLNKKREDIIIEINDRKVKISFITPKQLLKRINNVKKLHIKNEIYKLKQIEGFVLEKN